VGAHGGISLGGRRLAGERLAEELSRLSAANPDRPVMIEADTTAPYSAVTAVLDLCKRASLPNVSLFTMTTPEEEVPPLPKAEPDPGAELILPKQPAESPAPPVRIEISGDGGLTLDGAAMTLDAMRPELIELSVQGPGRAVEIEVEAEVSHETVLAVLDACREANLVRTSFKQRGDRLGDLDLAASFRNYEQLQQRLHQARLDREVLVAGGTVENAREIVVIDKLIVFLESSLARERVQIRTLERIPPGSER
jgi:biopolymer transport protein ExbD